METIMIYLLDSKDPYSFEQQLNQKAPLTEEAVVDLVISRASEREIQTFEDFLNEFQTDNFQLLNLYKKRKLIKENLDELEKKNSRFYSWNDPNQLKCDLLKGERKYRKIDDKNILFTDQVEADIIFATNLSILNKKRNYLKREHNLLDSIIKYNKEKSNEDENPPFNEISVLKKLFPDFSSLGQLNNLIFNMQGKRTTFKEYPILVYNGKVNFLWKELRQIWLTNNYDYKDIGYAISVHCKWKRTPSSDLIEFTPKKVEKGLSREQLR